MILPFEGSSLLITEEQKPFQLQSAFISMMHQKGG
jgi:hypothetical protein